MIKSELLKKHRKFVENNLLSLSVLFANIVITIFTLKFNVKLLGTEVYGMHLLLSNLGIFLNLVNFGFYSNLIVNLNPFNDNQNNTNKLINNYFLTHISLGFLGFILFYFLLIFPALITENSDLFVLLDFQIIKFSYPVLFLIQYVCVFFENILFYNYKVIKTRYIGDFFRLGGANLAVTGLLIIKPIQFFLVAVPIVFNLTVLFFYLYVFIKKSKFTFNFKQFNLTFIKSNFTNSINFWILQISFLVLNSMDAFFISKITGNMTLLVMYTQSFKLVDISQKITVAILSNKSPKLLEKILNHDFVSVDNIFKKMLLVCLTLSIVGAVFIFFFGHKILMLWLGESLQFDNNLIAVFSILLISSNMFWVYWNFFNLLKLQRKTSRIAIIEIILNISLSYILIKNYGLIGLALASLISNSISVILMFILYRKYIIT